MMVDVSDVTAAGVEPKSTVAPDTKFDPVTVMAVPPAVPPHAGDTALIEG